MENDRKRRTSTVRDYRDAVRARLKPALREATPIEDITTKDIDAFRAGLVDTLSPRTINKLLVILHGIFKRAQRTHGLATNPVAGAERQSQRRSGDFRVLDPGEVVLLAEQGRERPGRCAVHGRRVHRPAARRVACAPVARCGLREAARARPPVLRARP